MFKHLLVAIALFPQLFLSGCQQSEISVAQSKNKKGIATNDKNQTTGTSNQKSSADGKTDAEADLEKGILKIWTMPLPSPPWAAKHFQLCKDNGITLKATDSVEAFKTEYISGYNQRMTAEIDKKFGPGFIQKLKAEAQK